MDALWVPPGCGTSDKEQERDLREGACKGLYFSEVGICFKSISESLSEPKHIADPILIVDL